MKTMYVVILALLMMINAVLAKEEISKPYESRQESVLAIADVKAMLPVKDVNAGFRALEMLKKITQPEFASDKAFLLVIIYESQNTVENDSIPESPGQPTMARRLQIGALVELTKIPTEICNEQVLQVLQSYCEFMNSPQNPLNYTALIKSTHPRRVLELSMAALIAAHINNSDIRAMGSKYLAAPAFAEMTKGRIATGLLEYQIDNISDEDDPNLAQRLSLILETACLPSLEQMLKAPKRLARSAEIVSKLVNFQPERLLSFIENKSQLNDSQRYFLAYASIYSALRKVHMKQSLVSEDFRLIDLAEQWQQQLMPKTEKITNSDQLLNQAIEKWAKTQR